jgi:hypothetical protein
MSPWWVGPLNPIEPPATIKAAPFSKQWEVGFQLVSSLQPTLKWEPYALFTPSTEEQEPQPIPISNVTYALRVFRKAEGYSITWAYGKNTGNPGLLIYHRDGLVQPFHKLEKALEPDVEYFWTVRARFVLEDQTRVTEWSEQLLGGWDTVSYFGFKTSLQ